MSEDDIQRSKPSMDRELGKLADPRLVEELVEEISAGWKEPEVLPEHPTLLLLGGFQGSGKTSVIEELSTQLPITVISTDAIRHRLFQKTQFSDTFPHTVNAARNQLLERALATKNHIAIDENTHQIRLDLFRSMIEGTGYKTLAAYLQTPDDVLVERVTSRPGKEGQYKGTVHELKVYLQAERHDPSKYDMVFHTDQQSPREISEKLLQRIQESN